MISQYNIIILVDSDGGRIGAYHVHYNATVEELVHIMSIIMITMLIVKSSWYNLIGVYCLTRHDIQNTRGCMERKAFFSRKITKD